ncbi:MAG: hypothetical protein HZC14_02795 [Candidatus Niyogibacteria bacterium]|nr:hypothetical protein [Candidatus Niyogibacteria bacterium]
MTIDQKIINNIKNKNETQLIFLMWLLVASLALLSVLYIYFVNMRLSEGYAEGRLSSELNLTRSAYQGVESVYIQKLTSLNNGTAEKYGLVQVDSPHFVTAEDGKLAIINVSMR